ncbi:protein FAM200A-like [Palaemon carinicauda]|uniref:protein FAM200A-like n=1 Tax=Palaemon carinicauda TaxID=392227 RepID=UPI0035B647F9
MGAQHVGLLFYTRVRWLSRGKCLSRLYELRLETEIFLRENENNLLVHFDNEEFVMMLAYLADIFGRLNEMNQSLQGHDVTTQRIELPIGIKDCIIGHLDILSAEFKSYFDDAPLDVPWHRDPFNTEIEPTEDEAEELAELKVSKAMKLAFSNREDLSSFWLSVQDAYPLFSKKASEMHVQFATIYLCESGFSDLATIKTKSRNRLDVGNDIRLAVSKTEPDIRGLVTRAQQQVSH